jgi:hypothetical protein
LAKGQDTPSITLADALIESALAPLVAKGYLGETKGTVTVKGTNLAYSAGKFQGNTEYMAKAELLSLPSSLAIMERVDCQGRLDFADSMASGEGALSIAALTAAGVTVQKLGATLQGSGDSLKFDRVEVTLFAGTVKASGAIGFQDPAFPMHVAADVRNLDLSVFTTEFKPPSVILSGLVSGTTMVEFDLHGLKDLRVALHTTGGFSINRDALQQILLSQYVGNITGGATVEHVVDKVIGKSKQRAFDMARLDLGFEDGRLTGEARLESKDLKLTVDIKADPEALLEALKIRQEEYVNQVDKP